MQAYVLLASLHISYIGIIQSQAAESNVGLYGIFIMTQIQERTQALGRVHYEMSPFPKHDGCMVDVELGLFHGSCRIDTECDSAVHPTNAPLLFSISNPTQLNIWKKHALD